MGTLRAAALGFAAIGLTGTPLRAETTAVPDAAIAEIIVAAPGGRAFNDDAVVIDAADLSRGGHADLLPALARALPGLSLSDAQGNPYQPNLTYHGFVASPLQGIAQGLAVYLDGGRFNQPFGDTVDFDLLPEAAIDTISIRDASPVYGLNALGGAIIVATKTGRTAPGIAMTAAGGAYGRATGSVEAGGSRGAYSGYLAIEANHDGGWRRYSPSTLYTGFADLGYDGADAGLHVKLLAADTDLTGNGSAPVELLAVDRRAVFTSPDITRNRYGRVSLHSWVALSATTRIEASLYLQHLRQRTVNGDAADVDACTADPGRLCLGDAGGDEQLLVDATGATVTDTLGGGAYGVLNRSTTRTTAAGVLVQLADRRQLFGGENELTVGVSHDRSRTGFTAATELGALTADRSVSGLGMVIDQPDGVITPVSLGARTRYTGIFVSDRLPLMPGLTAEIGVRWNAAEILLDDRIGTALDGRHSFHRVNPGIELTYTVSPAIAVHGGYAETNRAPTPAELSCADPAAPCSLTNFFVGDPALRQVIARTGEAGASGRVDAGAWRFDWRVAGYRASTTDDIELIASGTRGRAYFQNVGATRRQGIDASLTATSGPWTMRAGYALTDATFRSGLLLNSPDNPSADGNGQILVRRGDAVPAIPRHRGLVSVDYAGRGFTAGGDVTAQSGQVLRGDAANLEPRTAGFAVVNLRGSVTLRGPVALFAELTNVFDARYATFGTFAQTGQVALAEAPGATDPRSLGPGAPRRWLAGLRARF